jgi:shikimate dehydrogenase
MKSYAANNYPISGKTVVCGIIGDPVEHTISPVMHNTAFLKLNLDYIYIPFKVEADNLAQAVRGLRALNLRGLNVTIPHKKAVISLLDEVDPLAELIGAVNTIVNNNGCLKGYNTDASGFIRSLTAEKVQPENKNIVILGAGGAARAVAFILADKGAELTIINRHLEPAQGLAGWLERKFRREVKALELNHQNLKEALNGADIVINSTSVGMTPQISETLVPVRLLKKDLTVVDIVYNPVGTRLLTEASRKGAKTISGLEMLVWQGAAAFELWTGHQAPVEEMRTAAIRDLEES